MFGQWLQVGNAQIADAYAEWKAAATVTYGCEFDRPSAASASLAEKFGMAPSGLCPAEMLFAVQAYYALVVTRLLRRRTGDQRETGLLAWYAVADQEPGRRLVREIDDLAASCDAAIGRDPGRVTDLFRQLYEDVFPRPMRHMLGEYYTPEWLARKLLDEVGYAGQAEARLLDPTCGSGVFLIEAIRRIRDSSGRPVSEADRVQLCTTVLRNVVGYDLNPLAVLTARANYLIAIADLLPADGAVDVPVYRRDSILGGEESGFDYVVGNPPWIAWDHLPKEYREATMPLWQKYGLFSLTGAEARHGGAKKDLSSLMVYVAAGRYLKDGGRLGMVVTQSLFQTKGAGDGFRRFRLGHDGPQLRVLGVGDYVALKPFQSAANWTATVVIEKGEATVYPVPYTKWLPNGAGGKTATTTAAVPRVYQAQPIDAARPTSPWFLWPEGWDAGRRCDALFGPSDYQAHLGANTGGANGVYWIEILGPAPQSDARGEQHGQVLIRNLSGKGKRSVPLVEHAVEKELIYPLLRWGDVGRYHAVPQAHLLMVQDAQRRRGIEELHLLADYPQTHAYLTHFRKLLCERAAYKRYQDRAAFYSMYDIGPYTLAPVKVVWRRMDRRINAAVVEEVEDHRLGQRPVIPQETCVLIATASLHEAHYLCAVLNSSVVGFLAISHSVRGGKGFGTPSMLEFLRLRRFDEDCPEHRELAAASCFAHEATARGEDICPTQKHIDELAGQLWNLGPAALAAIREEIGGG